MSINKRKITKAEKKQMRKTWHRLFTYVKYDQQLLIITIVFGIVTGLTQLLAPLLIARILDAFSQGLFAQTNNIIWLLVTYILSLISGTFLGINVAKLSNKVIAKLRQEAFEHMTKLPMSFFDTTEQGDMISRLTNDIQAVSIVLEMVFQQVFSGLLVLLGSVILMYSMNWIVATIILLLTPLSFLITSTIAFTSNRLFLDQADVTGKLQGQSEEVISGQKLIHAFVAEDKVQKEFDEYNNELYKVGQKALFISALTNPSTRLVNNTIYILVGVVSSILAAGGTLSVGQVSAFLNYALQYSKPVNELGLVMTQIQQGLASCERIFEILDIATEDQETKKDNLEFRSGNISFDSVNFRYIENRPLIEDFNLDVKAGQTIAIVGPTGAGKTTMVNLLMRFYEPQNGAIYIDGQDISAYKRDSVRAVYGMVLQDTWLLQGTIFANIAYGKEGATEAEVIEAAKQAQAHEFIMQLEDGYMTKLEDAGSRLSTGQKQLLTIARVFISKPDMLILDEATSDIDTRTEILIQNTFAKLMEGKTSFIIAHRLSTIREADLIIVMNKGHIIETGNHQELLAKKGFYWNLYNSQFAKQENI